MIRPLLSVRNLKCRYKAGRHVIRAVDGLDLDIGPKEVVGIVGESGSGKSTLALAMLGLLDAPECTVEGTISFKGRDLRTLQEDAWLEVRGRQIGMTFQSPERSFSPAATIGQQMAEALQIHRRLNKAAARMAAEQMLAKVGMPHPARVLESYAFELSGGMCQRAALALTVSLQPDLLIADEPTASLDLLAQTEVTQLLTTLRHQYRMAMVIVSHDLGLVARIADRVMIMYAGRIVESGPADQVLQLPRHPYTKGLLASIPRLGTKLRDIHALAGNPPDLTTRPAGCAFLPRCDQAGEPCRHEHPPLAILEGGRSVACWIPDRALPCHGRSGFEAGVHK